MLHYRCIIFVPTEKENKICFLVFTIKTAFKYRTFLFLTFCPSLPKIIPISNIIVDVIRQKLENKLILSLPFELFNGTHCFELGFCYLSIPEAKNQYYCVTPLSV